MILLALGAGLAFNPLLLAAMGDVPPEQSGLASGPREHDPDDGRRARPRDPREPRRVAHGRLRNDLGDLTAGYHAAFLVGAAFAIVGLVLAAVLMEAKMPAMGGAPRHGSPADASRSASPASPSGESAGCRRRPSRTSASACRGAAGTPACGRPATRRGACRAHAGREPLLVAAVGIMTYRSRNDFLIRRSSAGP